MAALCPPASAEPLSLVTPPRWAQGREIPQDPHAPKGTALHPPHLTPTGEPRPHRHRGLRLLGRVGLPRAPLQCAQGTQGPDPSRAAGAGKDGASATRRLLNLVLSGGIALNLPATSSPLRAPFSACFPPHDHEPHERPSATLAQPPSPGSAHSTCESPKFWRRGQGRGLRSRREATRCARLLGPSLPPARPRGLPRPSGRRRAFSPCCLKKGKGRKVTSGPLRPFP